MTHGAVDKYKALAYLRNMPKSSPPDDEELDSFPFASESIIRSLDISCKHQNLIARYKMNQNTSPKKSAKKMFGREISWLSNDIQPQALSFFEKYFLSSRSAILEKDISIKFQEFVCYIMNTTDKTRSITPDTLRGTDIKSFIDQCYDIYFCKFFQPYEDGIDIASLLRVTDRFEIPEATVLRKYAMDEISDSLENIDLNCSHFFYYCRSDSFVSTSSSDLIYRVIRNLKRPEYIDGKASDPWECPDNSGSYKESDNLLVASTFIFVWQRCKHRININDDVYKECEDLAKRALELLINHQLGDGSWSPNSKIDIGSIETTYAAIHALALFPDNASKPAIKRAGDWLSKQWQARDEEYWGNPAIDICCIDALNLSQDNFGQVTFNTESGTKSTHHGLVKPRIRFIHVSDLHYNPSSDGGTCKTLRDELLEELSRIKNLGVKIDDLFITGDYRHAARQSGSKTGDAVIKAVEYISQIADSIGINDCNHIHIIPGNHDLVRECLGAKIKIKETKHQNPFIRKAIAYDYYRNQYLQNNGIFSEEALAAIKTEFSFFETICEKVYSTNNPWRQHHPHTYRCVNGIVYLYINTAIFHHSDKNRDKKDLIIGTTHLESLLQEISQDHKGQPIIALAHHSPDFFALEEKYKLESLFEKYPVALYLCGDAHIPWWRMTNGHLEFTAGCTKVESGSQAVFMYGDMVKNEYVSYIWDNRQGWGEFSQFNDSLKEFLRKMEMQK